MRGARGLGRDGLVARRLEGSLPSLSVGRRPQWRCAVCRYVCVQPLVRRRRRWSWSPARRRWPLRAGGSASRPWRAVVRVCVCGSPLGTLGRSARGSAGVAVIDVRAWPSRGTSVLSAWRRLRRSRSMASSASPGGQPSARQGSDRGGASPLARGLSPCWSRLRAITRRASTRPAGRRGEASLAARRGPNSTTL